MCKPNERLIEQLFELMLETVWVSRDDPRRDCAAYNGFLQRVKGLVTALGRTPLEGTDAVQCGRLRQQVELLVEDVARLRSGGVITSGQQTQALRLLREVADEMGGSR